MTAEYNLGKGWHIDKRFTIGHIITTIVVGVSALMYITAIERRVSLLEAGDREQDARFERQSATLNRQFDKLESHLIRIENKIDKK